MKLIKRTYLQTFLWLIPVLLVGSVFSFYIIKYIVYEETDEHLTYEMQRLVDYHTKFNDLPEFHKVEDIIENLKLEQPVFKDTLILEEKDNEMIPYRKLLFTINHEDKDFTIVLQQLLPGNDDIFEGTLLMMLGLFILISLFLLLIVNTISVRLWSPFQKTLNTLTQYKITDAVPVFPDSNIDEFNSLNQTIEGLLNKIAQDYHRTKEFNENASHELQTHLAIIRIHAEKLLNSHLEGDEQLEHLQPIVNAASKLSKAQKSLLLLSKIGNLEYNRHVQLDLADTINNALSLFQEIIDIRDIEVRKTLETCIVNMDAGLAEIMVNNLLKNAIKHNIQHGFISILLTPQILIIENTGVSIEGNPEEFFERFTIGKTGNLGLGLAIIKQICEVNKFDISYTVKENIHTLKISFPLG